MPLTDRRLLALLATLGVSCTWMLPCTAAQAHSTPRTGRKRLERKSVAPDPGLKLAISTAEKYARAAGESGKLKLKVARASLAQAMAVTAGRAASAAETPISDSAPTGSRASAVYVVVIQTTKPHMAFTPNVSVPPGRKAPSGRVMSLILDANTAFVEGMTLSPSPPKLGELGVVTSTTFAASRS
jgi:hypothetical protein